MKILGGWGRDSIATFYVAARRIAIVRVSLEGGGGGWEKEVNSLGGCKIDAKSLNNYNTDGAINLQYVEHSRFFFVYPWAMGNNGPMYLHFLQSKSPVTSMVDRTNKFLVKCTVKSDKFYIQDLDRTR